MAAMMDKFEFDVSLGGDVELPHAINPFQYAARHLTEISTLISAIKNPTQNKLIFQTLPKHMRRRAMSHNPKRLPRRYRDAHKSQMLKSGVPEKTKCPSRKYRRKINNLLKDYQKRQRRNRWLETHIWHAKRFHMIDKWGYRLANSSCDKTYRSSYRATSKHCLIQDISYMGCIEINGGINELRKGFARITGDLNYNLGICSRIYTNGNREGSFDVFKANSYPLNALGQINFIWKPLPPTEQDDGLEQNEQVRTIWIFAHPLFYDELVSELISIFDLTKQSNDGTDEKKDIYCQDNLEYFINETLNLKLIKLKDMLNRFRLTGPLSNVILSNALKCKTFKNESPDLNIWTNEFFQQNKLNRSAHKNQKLFWKEIGSVNSPAELSPNMVIALNVEDPRINRPKKRTKALPENQDLYEINTLNNVCFEIPKYSGISGIWDYQLRKRVTNEKMSTHDYCSLRNRHALIPGEKCNFENNIQAVPILLIQRPGCQNNKVKKLGYSCGWDIILPQGYGIITWMSLIMWGGKPGGLREIQTICRESATDQFLPDTIAGKKLADTNEMELREKYFKMPPNKRINYKKLSIASPFKCQWMRLIAEWSLNNKNNTGVPDDFFVIRDKELIKKIEYNINKNISLKSITNMTNRNCLIGIYLIMDTRGNPGDFGLICLPKKIDLKKNLKKIKTFNNEPVLTEPLKNDDQENERKLLRINHKKQLKRLRRQRIRQRDKLQELSEKRVLISKPNTSKLIAEQYEKICEMWLPQKTESVKSIRKQCSRDVLGYITHCDFSFTEATVAAIGYITLNGLGELQKICGNQKNIKVLVRGTNSRQYRFANVKFLNSI